MIFGLNCYKIEHELKQDIVRYQRKPSQKGTSTDRRHDRSQKNLKLFVRSYRLNWSWLQFSCLQRQKWTNEYLYLNAGETVAIKVIDLKKEDELSKQFVNE